MSAVGAALPISLLLSLSLSEMPELSRVVEGPSRVGGKECHLKNTVSEFSQKVGWRKGEAPVMPPQDKS